MGEALREVGFDARAYRTGDLDELERALAATEGLIVGIGGDGTARELALRLRGRPRPLALLPRGTANNVAASLGLDEWLDAAAFARGLARPRRRDFDLGRVAGPWGESYFLEGFGVGLYAELLRAYRPEDGKDPLRALDALEGVLSGFEPLDVTLSDGTDTWTGPFLLVAVMNTPRLGMRLPLAPWADPGDGRLDLVLLREAPSRSLFEVGARLLRGTLEEADGIDVVRVRLCDLRGLRSAYHVDDAHVGVMEAGGVQLRVDVLPAALEVWVPETP